MSITLYPLNDFAVEVHLQQINTSTGKVEDLTTGTVTAFLATANTPTTAAADPSLSTSAAHLGNGQWLVAFDASVLTVTLLASLFAAATPYLIVEQANEVRAYVALEYSASRAATVA